VAKANRKKGDRLTARQLGKEVVSTGTSGERVYARSKGNDSSIRREEASRLGTFGKGKKPSFKNDNRKEKSIQIPSRGKEASRGLRRQSYALADGSDDFNRRKRLVRGVERGKQGNHDLARKRSNG